MVNDNNNNVPHIRKNYSLNELTENNIPNNPFTLFELWFADALECGIEEPNAMTLATSSKGGKPSARIVLLKSFDEKGFLFFTNYESRKGKEIADNPFAALVFHWKELERQVRITGTIGKAGFEESQKYFNSRPIDSRIGAIVSKQSEVIINRDELLDNFNKTKTKYDRMEIPLPHYWGGYRVIPNEIEFWQGRPNRLHDRILFFKKNDIWLTKRLAP